MIVDGACAICLARFVRPEDISALICGHIYHLACIQESLKHRRECPTCRKSATAKSIVHQLFFTGVANADASLLLPDDGRADGGAKTEPSPAELVERLKVKVSDLDGRLVDEQRKSYELQSRLDRQSDALKETKGEVTAAKKKQRRAEDDAVSLRERLAIVENELCAKADVERKLKACRIRLKAVEAMEHLLNGPSSGAEQVCENMNLDAQSQAVVVALKRQYDELRGQKSALAERLAASQKQLKQCRTDCDKVRRVARKLREELVLTRCVKGNEVGSPFDPALGRVLGDETCDSSSMLLGHNETANASAAMTPGTVRALVCGDKGAASAGTGGQAARADDVVPDTPVQRQAAAVLPTSAAASPDMYWPTPPGGEQRPPRRRMFAAFCNDADDDQRAAGAAAAEKADVAPDVFVRLPGGFVCGGPSAGSTNALLADGGVASASDGLGARRVRQPPPAPSQPAIQRPRGAAVKRPASGSGAAQASNASKRGRPAKQGGGNVQRLSSFFARATSKEKVGDGVILLD